MKRIINRLLLLPLVALAVSGCTKEEIVFDHEKPQFEIRSDAILLEVILPTNSVDDDSYFIVGPFNGGAEVAVDNPTWQLQRAETGIRKWGIYLNPASFTGGKTLADGFTFVSKSQGEERTVFNEPAEHTLDVAVGSRTNVWVAQWKAFFDPPPAPKEFYTLYAEIPATWAETGLWLWHDNPDGTTTNAYEAWPGAKPTGERVFDGTRTFYYWEIDKKYNGMTMNYIFNDNNKGNQTADIRDMVINQDRYYSINEDKSFEEVDPATLGEWVEGYSGYTIYVEDQTGWDNLAIYAEWQHSPVSPVFPGWQSAGTKEVDGIVYKYFQPGKELNGQTMNFIFNSGVKGGPEIEGPEGYVLDHDVFFQVTADGWDTPFEGKGVPHYIYVEDKTGWERLNVYYWDSGSDPAWPGLAPSREETIGGTTYKVFETPALHDGATANLIFNNKVEGDDSGSQYDVATVTLTRDFYFTATAEAASEKVFKVYVNDQTGWDALALYGWGDNDFNLGAWPGLQPSGTETLGSITYTVFDLPVNATTVGVNLIFNNNNNGEQFDGPAVTVDRDFYFTITADGVTATVWVDDQSGWDALALYAWGDYGFDPWPGLAPTGTETAGSVTYTLFELPAEAYGKNENLIFNNNDNGSQLPDVAVKVVGDMFFRITDSAATEVKPFE